MRILVVEDLYANQQNLQGILAQSGKVDLAEDGPEPIRLFNQAHQEGRPYGLVFLALAPPTIAEYQAARHIRAFEEAQGIVQRAILVIATKALFTQDILAIFQRGADLYLEKPFSS